MSRNIGNTVRRLRIQKNMTQEQLAESIDICVAYVSKIENNHVTNISLEIACSLADVFNVSIGYLIGSEKNMDESNMLDEMMIRKYSVCTNDEKKKILKIIDIIRNEDEMQIL